MRAAVVPVDPPERCLAGEFGGGEFDHGEGGVAVLQIADPVGLVGSTR
jgi:hypothetical protein